MGHRQIGGQLPQVQRAVAVDDVDDLIIARAVREEVIQGVFVPLEDGVDTGSRSPFRHRPRVKPGSGLVGRVPGSRLTHPGHVPAADERGNLLALFFGQLVGHRPFDQARARKVVVGKSPSARRMAIAAGGPDHAVVGSLPIALPVAQVGREIVEAVSGVKQASPFLDVRRQRVNRPPQHGVVVDKRTGGQHPFVQVAIAQKIHLDNAIPQLMGVRILVDEGDGVVAIFQTIVVDLDFHACDPESAAQSPGFGFRSDNGHVGIAIEFYRVVGFFPGVTGIGFQIHGLTAVDLDLGLDLAHIPVEFIDVIAACVTPQIQMVNVSGIIERNGYLFPRTGPAKYFDRQQDTVTGFAGRRAGPLRHAAAAVAGRSLVRIVGAEIRNAGAH